MLRLIGFYDYTVILTYLSLLSAVIGMNFAAKGACSAAVLCLLFSGLCATIREKDYKYPKQSPQNKS